MKRREIVADLVKAAFIALNVKVMASSSLIMPWNSLVDDLCVIFAIVVMFIKTSTFTIAFRKLITLAAVALFALYTCLITRQYDLLITVIGICLLIDEDLEAYISLMFKLQVAILTGHIVVSGFWSLTGRYDYFWATIADRLRFNGGFIHSNVFSCFILSCMVMFVWMRFKRITPIQFAGMACITVLSYILNRSRTGLLLNIFLLLIVILTQKKSKLLEKAIDPILFPLFPAMTALVFWAQGQFVAGNDIAVLLDNLLTSRIKYAAYAYTQSGVTWLPRYLDYVESGVVTWTSEWELTTFTFDNLYSCLFVQMGIVWIGVISVMIAAVCKKFDFKNKLVMLIWVLFAMVEVHGINCFKFFPLILLSALLSEKGAEGHSKCND